MENDQPFTLRPYQADAVARGLEYFSDAKQQRPVIEVLPTGCHAAGTMILLANGKGKRVEDIRVGDKLMGPDSLPRTVLRLCGGRGEMYEITPIKGEPFVVNGEHMLALISTSEGRGRYPSQQRGTERCVISVCEYLKKANNWRHLRKLYRSESIEFPVVKRKLFVPPYILGVLLGDGCVLNGGVNVTSADEEIIDEIKAFVCRVDLSLRISHKKNSRAVDLHIIKKENRFNRMYVNALTAELRALNIMGRGSEEKFIPFEYKTLSIQERLDLVAGLIDTDGSLSGASGYDYVTKSRHLANDMTFVCRSLGFSVYISLQYKACQTGVGDYYYRLSVSGDVSRIPCRVKRKIANTRRQKKRWLVTGFRANPVGVDDFYGFTLDGDQLYLTGDFFVHHNSGKSVVIAGIAKELDEPTIVFQPSKEILEQNYGKLRSYGVTDCSIFSASFNSKEISKLTYATIGSVIHRKDEFRDFKYVIMDECHFASAKTGMYKEFFDMVGAKMIGLTATPYRLNFDAYGGAMLKFLTRTRPRIFDSVIYNVQIAELFEQGYLARLRYDIHRDFDSSKLTLNTHGTDFTEKSIKEYFGEVGFAERVFRTASEYAAVRKNVLVFTQFVEEAENLAAKVGGAVVSAETPAKERAEIIRKFRSGEIKIVANVGVLSTGFDYPELETVILARPTNSLALYYQMIGRGIRPNAGKEQTQVVDMCGNFGRFGKIEDLKLVEWKPGLWQIESNGKRLTNVYFGGLTEKQKFFINRARERKGQKV